MIQYTLKCADGHRFDSWFQSASAFDKLLAGGMVGCAVCGSGQVEKAVMTPRVRPSRAASGKHAGNEAPPDRPGPLSAPASPAEQALAELRKRVEENSDYVGRAFAAEARAIHDGTAPERPIWGEARADEARALVEDGVPVSPLPFMPTRKTN
ncbi:MAG: DUF1178 family protein [Rhodobacteraceae bacterium]|nr:DUF1178 family protein [Paracoccaceae bacterium]